MAASGGAAQLGFDGTAVSKIASDVECACYASTARLDCAGIGEQAFTAQINQPGSPYQPAQRIEQRAITGGTAVALGEGGTSCHIESAGLGEGGQRGREGS